MNTEGTEHVLKHSVKGQYHMERQEGQWRWRGWNHHLWPGLCKVFKWIFAVCERLLACRVCRVGSWMVARVKLSLTTLLLGSVAWNQWINLVWLCHRSLIVGELLAYDSADMCCSFSIVQISTDGCTGLIWLLSDFFFFWQKCYKLQLHIWHLRMINFFFSSKKQLFSKWKLHYPNLCPLLDLGFRVWMLVSRDKGQGFRVWGWGFRGNLQGVWRKFEGELETVRGISLEKVTSLGSNLVSVTDLKRIETPHSLCCDFGGYKTFTTRWSGGRVQVWVQVWAPACHLAISPKAVPEGNQRFRGQTWKSTAKHLGQLSCSAWKVGRASINTGRFPVGGSRCRQLQAHMRKTLKNATTLAILTQFKSQQGFHAL